MINSVAGVGGAASGAGAAGISSTTPASASASNGTSGADASAESPSRLTIELPLLPDGTIAIPGGVVLPNNSPSGVTALMELMQGFSMAEMLMAMLMMAAAQEKDDNDEKSGAAAMLAGLALAAASQDSISINLQINGSMVSDTANLGTQMDLSA